MIAKHNKKSLFLGGIGIIGVTLGATLTYNHLALFGGILALLGLVLLTTGFVFYAKAKGRHPLWGFLHIILIALWLIISFYLKDIVNNIWGYFAFVPTVLNLIILSLLEDKYLEGENIR